jgi:hypothetical protein
VNGIQTHAAQNEFSPLMALGKILACTPLNPDHTQAKFIAINLSAASVHP